MVGDGADSGGCGGGGVVEVSGVSEEETCMASFWLSSQAFVESFLNAK